MKTSITLFAALVLTLAGLNWYGKPSDNGKLCPINLVMRSPTHVTYKVSRPISSELDNYPKYAPNAMHRVSRPPVSGDDGECPSTPEMRAIYAAIDAELPLVTTGKYGYEVAQPGKHPGLPKPQPTAKPNPAKPNPAKPNPAKPNPAKPI